MYDSAEIQGQKTVLSENKNEKKLSIKNLLLENHRSLQLETDENTLDQFVEHLGLDNIDIKKLNDNNFNKTLQDLIDGTLSGNIFYLLLTRRVLEKIHNPQIIENLIANFQKKINDEILLGLIVVLKRAIGDKQIANDRKHSDSPNKSTQQFFNRFIDLYMTMDPTSQALINKILAPRLIKMRQIIARAYIEKKGEITQDILNELKEAIESFPETAGKETDPGCSSMTPAGIRRVCQILLPLCTLMVGDTNSPKIKLMINFDNGESFEIELSLEAIALAYSIINDVNLDSAIEKSQNDCKSQIAVFNGKSDQLIKKIAPYFFSMEELKEDLITASFDISLIFAPVYKLIESIKNTYVKDMIQSLTKTIKTELVCTVQNDLYQLLKNNKSENDSENLIKQLVYPLKIYLEKMFHVEQLDSKLVNRMSKNIDKLFNAIDNKSEQEIDVFFMPQKKETAFEEALTTVFDNIKIELIPEGTIKEIKEGVTSALTKKLAERALLLKITTTSANLSSDNFNNQIKNIRDIYKNLNTIVIAEKTRVMLKEGTPFQQLMEELAKIAKTYEDVNLLKDILKNDNRKFAQLFSIENKEFADTLYVAANNSALSDKDIKNIRASLEKLKFHDLKNLDNSKLGLQLYQATQKYYSKIHNTDVVKILKCILSKDLNALNNLKNQRLGNLLYQFLNNDVELANHLHLKFAQSFGASLAIGGLTVMPSMLVVSLIKSALRDQPLPKGQDLPSLGRGLAMQQTSNLESTLKHALNDAFITVPSLGRAFNNTHIELFSAIENFFHQPHYWIFPLELLQKHLRLNLKQELDKNNKKSLKDTVKSLTNIIDHWKVFLTSITNLMQSPHFLEAFKTEWKKHNFREQWQNTENYYDGTNSFMFLMKFTKTFFKNVGNKPILVNIIEKCDSIIRKGLMGTTTAAIEQIGKPLTSRPQIIVPKKGTAEEQFDFYTKQLGIYNKVKDYVGVEYYYSEILKKTFIGMTFPKDLDGTILIKRNSDFGRFLESRRTDRNNNNSNEQIRVSRAPKEWNKAIYQRVIKIFSELDQMQPKHKLCMALPLAVNARDLESAKDLIIEFITNYQNWPIVDEIKHIFMNLKSELGIDANSLMTAIDNREKDKINNILAISGSFDISIIFANQKENAILKAYNNNDSEIAQILIKHCVEQKQLYPLLEAFTCMPIMAKRNSFYTELVKAIMSLGLDSAYKKSINKLLFSELSTNQLFNILLPQVGELKDNALIHEAIIKVINSYRSWPLIEKIELIFKKDKLKLSERKLFDVIDDSQITQLKKLLNRVLPLYISKLTAQGQNPLLVAIEKKQWAALSVLLKHCVYTKQSYPVLDAVLKGKTQENVKLRSSFQHALDLLHLQEFLSSYRILDNLFKNDQFPLEHKLKIALHFAFVTGNTIVMYKAVSLYKHNFQTNFDTLLTPFFKELPLYQTPLELKDAIEQDDSEKLKSLLDRINKLDISILTANRQNPLVSAFENDKGSDKKLFKMLLEHCIKTRQLLPTLVFFKMQSMEFIKDMPNIIENSKIELGYIDTDHAELDEQQKRENSFLDWYGINTPLTSKTLTIFDNYQNEFFELYKHKQSAIKNYPSYVSFMKFSKQLKNCTKSQIAKTSFDKMKIHLIENPDSLPSRFIVDKNQTKTILDQEKLNELIDLFEIEMKEILTGILQGKINPKCFTGVIQLFGTRAEEITLFLTNELKQLACSSNEQGKVKILIAMLKQLTNLPLKEKEEANNIFLVVKKFVEDNQLFSKINSKKLQSILSQNIDYTYSYSFFPVVRKTSKEMAALTTLHQETVTNIDDTYNKKT